MIKKGKNFPNKLFCRSSHRWRSLEDLTIKISRFEKTLQPFTTAKLFCYAPVPALTDFFNCFIIHYGNIFK